MHPHLVFFLARVVLLFAVMLPPGMQVLGASAPVSGYRVIARYPHSTANYTEGFLYRDGLFYEGTGLQERSAVLVTKAETGKVVQRRELPPPYFGEGIVDVGPNLYEWTWQSHIGFVYDRFSLRILRQFTYTGEGWGMTRDGQHIITSDGTSILRFRDPETFREVRHILVKDAGLPIEQLNELEYIKGEIYANVWHSDRIVRISPRDGHVIGWIDFAGLLPASQRVDAESVLNGIAYDAKGDRLFVTWQAVALRLPDPCRASPAAPRKSRFDDSGKRKGGRAATLRPAS
jgi:glutamine cyclotransferase